VAIRAGRDGLPARDVAMARVIVDRYRDLDVGLADASIIVLAAR
jgi:hypothetical protein